MAHDARAEANRELLGLIEEAADEIAKSQVATTVLEAEKARTEGDELASEGLFANAVRLQGGPVPAAEAHFQSRYGLSPAQSAAALFFRPVEIAYAQPTARPLPTPPAKPLALDLPADGTIVALLETGTAKPLPLPATQAIWGGGTLIGVGLDQSPFDGRPALALSLDASDKGMRYYLHGELPVPGGWGFGLGGEYYLFKRRIFHGALGAQYQQHKSDSGKAMRELGATIGARLALSRWLALDATWRPNVFFWIKDKAFGAGDVLHPSPLEIGGTAILFGNFFVRLRATTVPGADRALALQALVGFASLGEGF